MKASELIGQMTFSHRPQDGISVGFAVIAGVAYMSVGFVRDGDFFNRKLARNILAQRIISTIETDRDVKFVQVIENVPEQLDSRAVVREFRKLFKPDHNCNDITFSRVSEVLGISFRQVESRENSWLKITHMFEAAVTAATNTPARISQ